MNKRIKIVIVGLFVLFFLAASSWPTYYVWDLSNVWLLWNSKEAYVFAGVSRKGFRLTCLEYLFEYAEEYFYVVPPINDKASYTQVLRATPSTVERYTIDKIDFESYVPLDNEVYGGRNGVFWKWTGNRFEEVSKDQQKRLWGRKDSIFFNVDGWSRVSLSGKRPYSNITFELEGHPVTISTIAGDSDTSVAISLPGRPSEKVFYLDQRFHRVNGTEYGRIFGEGATIRLGGPGAQVPGL